MMKKAKSEFFHEKIAENESDPEKQLGYSNRLQTKAHNLNLDIDGTITSDKLTVANTFNNYCTTIANTL